MPPVLHRSGSCVTGIISAETLQPYDAVLVRWDASQGSTLLDAASAPVVGAATAVQRWNAGDGGPADKAMVALHPSARVVTMVRRPGVFLGAGNMFSGPTGLPLVGNAIAVAFRFTSSFATPTGMSTIFASRTTDLDGHMILRRDANLLRFWLAIGGVMRYVEEPVPASDRLVVCVWQWVQVGSNIVLQRAQTATGVFSSTSVVANGTLPSAPLTTIPLTVGGFRHNLTEDTQEYGSDVVMHELRVYKRPLTQVETTAVWREMTTRWT